MNIKKQLGVKIKRLRMKNGLTQEQLAEKIDIAPRTLSGIETGENFLTADTLEKILLVKLYLKTVLILTVVSVVVLYLS